MKNLIAILAVLGFTCQTQAQLTSGVIIYERKINMHKRIGDRRPELKDLIPEYNSSKMELLFTPTATVYRRHKDPKAQPPSGRGGRFGMMQANREVFRNLRSGDAVESREWDGKNYLIAGSEAPPTWKITGEQAKIAGYLCTKAVLQDTTADRNTEAWFTLQIPVASGPENYHQLPGMILAVSINGDELTYFATEIIEEAPEPKALEAPTKGKAITRQEFNKMVRMQLERFREEGGNGSFRIRGEN